MAKRSAVRVFQLALAAFLIPTATLPILAQTFNVVDLDNGSLGLYTNIALDAADKAHVVFCDRGLTTESFILQYATNASGSWQVVFPPPASSTDKKLYPSVAIGPDGLPKIAYFDGNTQHPMLIEKTPSGWTTPQVIDPTSNAGQYPHVAIDALGGVHVSYFVGGGGASLGGLHYGYRAPGSQTWTNQIIDHRIPDWEIGTLNDIAVGPDNVPRVIYSVLRVGFTHETAVARPGGSPVTCPPEGWCFDTIYDNVPQGVGIAVASDGTEHAVLAVLGTCYHAKRVGGVWQSAATVASGVQNPWPLDLAIDDTGTPAIAFSRAGDVALAVTDGSQWAVRSVTLSSSPRYVSLRLNNDYLARIVYDGSGTGAPQYAEQVEPVAVRDSREQSELRLAVSPNPSTTSSLFHVAVPIQQRITLRVYDVKGRLTRTITDQYLPAGIYTFKWDLRESSGARVRSGVYFAKLVTALGERNARVAVVQ